MDYLNTEAQRTMVKTAIYQLEEKIFEAQINAAAHELGGQCLVGQNETADQRIESCTRQIERLKESYAELLAELELTT